MTSPGIEIPWTTVIGVIVTIVSTFGGIMAYLAKALSKSMQKNIEDQLSEYKLEIESLKANREKYFEAHNRIRDKWEDFLKEYLKIDSTRGQKIDALFRIVDQMQETVKDLRPTMNLKIEESFARSISELKLYVRDQLREEDHGRRKLS